MMSRVELLHGLGLSRRQAEWPNTVEMKQSLVSMFREYSRCYMLFNSMHGDGSPGAQTQKVIEE